MSKLIKRVALTLPLLLAPLLAQASTTLTRSGAVIPSVGDQSWGATEVTAWGVLDATMSVLSANETFTGTKTFLHAPVLNGGTNATTLTYWRGDGTWSQPTAPIPTYRRPGLKYNDATHVSISTGLVDGTAYAQVMFPDGSVRSDSTTARIQLNVAQTAALSGGAQSGVRVSTAIVNTWYACYAVKTTDNSSNFVIVADTVTPIPANYATLNTNFGTNGWLYLGLIRHGDGAAGATGIVRFVQHGNKTVFNNNSNNNVQRSHGILMAGTAGATTLTYTYAAGSTATKIPENVLIVDWLIQAAASAGTSGIRLNVQDASATWWYASAENGNVAMTVPVPSVAAADGIALVTTGSPSLAYDIQLTGLLDDALGVGTNPLF